MVLQPLLGPLQALVTARRAARCAEHLSFLCQLTVAGFTLQLGLEDLVAPSDSLGKGELRLSGHEG
eukprot:1030649-Pyramimonas_sp.AAC.1